MPNRNRYRVPPRDYSVAPPVDPFEQVPYDPADYHPLTGDYLDQHLPNETPWDYRADVIAGREPLRELREEAIAARDRAESEAAFPEPNWRQTTPDERAPIWEELARRLEEEGAVRPDASGQATRQHAIDLDSMRLLGPLEAENLEHRGSASLPTTGLNFNSWDRSLRNMEVSDVWGGLEERAGRARKIAGNRYREAGDALRTDPDVEGRHRAFHVLGSQNDDVLGPEYTMESFLNDPNIPDDLKAKTRQYATARSRSQFTNEASPDPVQVEKHIARLRRTILESPHEGERAFARARLGRLGRAAGRSLLGLGATIGAYAGVQDLFDRLEGSVEEAQGL